MKKNFHSMSSARIQLLIQVAQPADETTQKKNQSADQLNYKKII